MPIHAIDRTWILETSSTAYAFGLNANDVLAHCYWGARLLTKTDYPTAPDFANSASFYESLTRTPEEYPPHGGARFIDPCLKVLFADGVRDVVLSFGSAEVQHGTVPELLIHLHDSVYPFRVTLHYRVYERYDLIERRVTVHNDGDTPITLERIWSAQWHLPAHENYRLTHLTGRWFDEMHLRREPLVQGIKVLESRRLTTSHHHNPWFAVDDGSASEDSGSLFFGLLAWSGNWKLSAEVTDFGSTRVSMGLNDWDFAWQLNPGDTFSTPSSYAGFTDEGYGGASRRLHDVIRDTVLPHGSLLRKVLYNSWEATEFAIDEASQIELAQRAAAIGVELFVLDDGWFHGRNDDTAGLGDWWPDERKFPHGLRPLISQVNALGMEFGLWIEPEMVNPDSDLYRTHPEWVIHFPTRTRTELRNQLILNFGRTDVQEYIIGQLDRLLSENRIAFIKWDMNRNVSEPGWPDAPGDMREIWVRYVQGLYGVWGTLRERHPTVVWQSCSGGGGRADLAILRLADQVWVSDNTDATARLAIQEGYSQVFPANTMEAWVTDRAQGRLSVTFRFHVSMCGALGVGGHLLHWSDEQCTNAANLIAQYKDIRHIVQFGDLYRLRSPQKHAFSAVQYVSKDASESVLFAFRTHLPPPAHLPLLYLRGLDAGAMYAIEGFRDVRSGQGWMKAGIVIELDDFESTVRRIRKVE
ncbi:MAG: alpha-galactosidase [Herpetosiphon sp.]